MKGNRMDSSYSRRRGGYVYDIEIHETRPPTMAGRFCAHLVNRVQREAGGTVTVNSDFHDEYGPTRGDAVLKIEAAMEQWVKKQTSSH
jgi:hypothetical protein